MRATNGQNCDPPPGAPCALGFPVPLVGTFEVASPKFDDPLNLVVPIPRRDGYYAAILGIGYARDGGGEPLAVPLHNTYIAFEQLNDSGAAFAGAAKYVLLDRQVRFFTILSDGERSLCPPYVGGGAAPFGLVISSDGTGAPALDGQLRAYLRWMPKTNAYPGNVAASGGV